MKQQCAFPRCKVQQKLERHHVTYTNTKSGIAPKVVPLCADHHDRITALNSMHKTFLSNEERVKLFEQWMTGKRLVLNFKQAGKVKLSKYAKINLEEAREHSYVVLYLYDGKKYNILGYATGKDWDCCPTCGRKL